MVTVSVNRATFEMGQIASPLNRLSSTFTEMRIVVHSAGSKWKQDVPPVTSSPAVLKVQLTQLCTGHSSANPESKWSKILKTDRQALRSESEAQEKVASSVAAPTLAAHPSHEAKGKGKEVDPIIAPDPVTVSASEKLKTFAKEADERRKAEKTATEAKLTAIDSEYAAQKARSEQEHAERLQRLEEDIAAELDGLRSEVQMEEGS